MSSGALLLLATAGLPDAVPLYRYFSADALDTLVTADRQFAEGLTGYAFVRVEGLVFPQLAGGSCSEGLLPLWQMARAGGTGNATDHMLTSLSTAAGYHILRQEGCAHPPSAWLDADPDRPCAPLQLYRSDDLRRDTAAAVRRESVEDVRGDNGGLCGGCGYSFLRLDSCLPTRNWTRWDPYVPADSPLPRSDYIQGMSLSGRTAYYSDTGADTWYPSWGSDGNLYSVWTDGVVGVDVGGGMLDPAEAPPAHAAQVRFANEVQCCSSCGVNDTQNIGAAVLSGSDPFRLRITPTACIRGSAYPYGGRYPSASLHHDGVWYVGSYGLWPAVGRLRMGPFVGFHYSTDGGRTWVRNESRTAQGTANLFGEPGCTDHSATGCSDKPIRFGAPHVVDFGQGNEAAPGGRVYLVGHGCLQLSPHWQCDWHVGDSVFLARSKGPPTPAQINSRDFWEFYAGKAADGSDRWTQSLADSAPLFEWPPHGAGIVTITYNQGLGRYLCVVSTPANGTVFDSYVLESESLTGPYRMAAYLRGFGEQAYFLNFVSKFWSKADPRIGMIAYSADYTFNTRIKPAGSRYGLVLQEVRLELK